MARRLKQAQIQALAKKTGIRPHRNSLRFKMSIRKGDTVQVIAGDDKGVVGEVLSVLPEKNMVVVEGVNKITRHVKPQRQGEQGEIIIKEAPIPVCKVMAYSKKEKVTSRIAHTFTADGKKVRMLKRTGEILDS